VEVAVPVDVCIAVRDEVRVDVPVIAAVDDPEGVPDCVNSVGVIVCVGLRLDVADLVAVKLGVPVIV